jgi:hypothetical protein
VLVVGVAAAELAVGTAVAGRGWHSTVVHPVRSVQDLRRAGELAVSAPDREALLAGQRAVLTTTYQALIPEFELEAQDPSVPAVTGPSPAVVQALSGARVHAEPWAVGLVWAYHLQWAPVPVFQTYSAYTPLLDRLNARALAGPETTGVLRQSAAIDGKHPLWESPRYQVQLLCRFREAAADVVWQALRRGPDRCGAPRSLGTASAGPGETVAVPSADGALVVATVTPRPGGPGVKDDHPMLRCDDRPYRVAQGFPSGPLVLDAAATGWSPTLLPAPCHTVTANAGVDIAFTAVPVSP